MLQFHYIRVSFARPALFFAIGLALMALGACTTTGDGPDDKVSSSSSEVDNPPEPGISSSSDEDNPPVPGSSSSLKPSSSSSLKVNSSSSLKLSSSSDDGNPPAPSSSSTPKPASSSSSGPDDLGVKDAIVIKFKSNDEPEIKNDLSAVKITKTGANVVITTPDDPEAEYNFVISGTTSNGSLKFYGDVRKTLYLNGVSITNSAGSAINIQKSKRIIVNLVKGTQNSLTDNKGYKCSDSEEKEKSKGTFFSEGKLQFEGEGSLEVKGKCNHAIVVDNDIEVKSGKINVSESVNDGMHANDRIIVSGGEITIKSTGDAIQSEKETQGAVNEWLVFSGGKINVQTTGIKSHGIASEGPVTINGSADITIKVSGDGAKGMRVRSWVEFEGGKTSIETTGTKYVDPGDSEDESNSAGIKLSTQFFFNSGELTVKTTGDGAKGVNVDGGASIKGGKINIDANDDGLRVHGTLKIEGGTGSIKSKKKDAIKADTWDNKKGSITTQDGVS